jgi:hypothetical protein
MKGSDPFLILGFLLMEATTESCLRRTLRHIAVAEGVHDEVHFSKLPKDVTGRLGGKFRVSEAWLEELHRLLVEGSVWLTVLAVDRKKIDRKKIPEPYMFYNRFSKMGIDSTLARYAQYLDTGTIRLIVHCDAHCLKRATGGQLGDNYSQYLQKQLRESFNRKSAEKGRLVTLRGVRVRMEDSQESTVLQLVDVVVGALRQHAMNDASRMSKVSLAKSVGAWLTGPGRNSIRFGRFSAQRFPGDEGAANGARFSPMV